MRGYDRQTLAMPLFHFLLTRYLHSGWVWLLIIFLCIIIMIALKTYSISTK